MTPPRTACDARKDGGLPQGRRPVSSELASGASYLFLCRIALSIFFRLCLAIFLRRFFLRFPIMSLLLPCDIQRRFTKQQAQTLASNCEMANGIPPFDASFFPDASLPAAS